jgi:hypothetical protein
MNMCSIHLSLYVGLYMLTYVGKYMFNFKTNYCHKWLAGVCLLYSEGNHQCGEKLPQCWQPWAPECQSQWPGFETSEAYHSTCWEPVAYGSKFKTADLKL